MTTKRCVLQVVPRLVTGGVERGTVEMVAALVAAGWQAVIASEGGPMAKEITRAGGQHIALPLASKNPYIIWRNIDRLVDIIEAHEIDIVHARSRAPAWSAYAAAHRTGRHFVTTFHNAYGGKSRLKRLYNSVMAKGEIVIAISDFVAAYAKRVYGVPEKTLRTIHRGVNTDIFDRAKIDPKRIEKLRQDWKVPADKPVVLMPGRLTRWKGQTVFIEAVAQMQRRDFIGLIVGSGDADYWQELGQRIKLQGLADSVRLVNECKDMPAAFCLADLVVSASTRPEGFGRVIVEAQAMGCLVIATQHGGAEETIIPGITGVLIPPGDAAELAAAIDEVLALPVEKRKKIGMQAIDHVRKNFTTALMTTLTLAVYDELLNAE